MSTFVQTTAHFPLFRESDDNVLLDPQNTLIKFPEASLNLYFLSLAQLRIHILDLYFP